MLLRKNFVRDFLIVGEFDAVGLCYLELLKYKPDANIGFVSQYIERINRESVGGCEYSKRFEILRINLKKSAQKNSEQYSDGKKLKIDLMKRVDNFKCPRMYDRKVSIAIIMFYLIEALDYYIQLMEQYLDEYDENTGYGSGPGNKGKSTRYCSVYLKCRRSFLDDAYADGAYADKRNENKFRKQLNEECLGDVFSTVQIVDNDRLIAHCGIPQIVRVKFDKGKNKAIEKKRITVATIPFIGFETFHFHELDAENYCTSRENLKGSFYIEYPAELEEENTKKVIRLLETAIEKGANIVIFPEFIMSPFMKEGISRYLSHLDSSQRHELIMVLAGTTYEFKRPDRGNNVLHVMNARGTEIARYYKYSPFHKDTSRHISSDRETTVGNTYYENMEILSNRGKECMLLDVDGIGRILPAVCRDVVDGVYTSTLVGIFSPHLLLIPAWSTSVASFDTYMKQYANTIHTSSFLCNCCDAVPLTSVQKQTKIGMFCIPEKKESVMNATPNPFYRSIECHFNCRNSGGCVRMTSIDYSDSIPKGLTMPALILQKEK